MKPLPEQLQGVSAASIEEARRKTIVGPKDRRPTYDDKPRFTERGRA